MYETRLRALRVGIVASGFAILVAGLVGVSFVADATVLTGHVGPVPFVVLLVVSIPLTILLCRNALTLAELGGGVQIALDSAVLTFVVWCGLAMPPEPGGAGSSVASGAAIGAVALMAWLAGVLASEMTRADKQPVIRLFNVAMSAIGGAGLVTVAVAARGLAGGDATMDVGPVQLAALVIGSAIYVGVDAVVTGASVAWANGQKIRAAIGDDSALLAGGLVIAVNAGALLAATLLAIMPWATSLLVPAAAALVAAARVGTNATAERRRAHALYNGVAACQSAADADAVVVAVLDAAADAVAANVRLSSGPPTAAQIGAEVRTAVGCGWLVADERPAGHAFVPADGRALSTLAALTEQSLARITSLDLVREMAETDDLTGLYNRRAFADAIRKCLPAREPISVLFGDLDGFKGINDVHGHGVGDAVLQAVARRLRATIRTEDIAARLGGDEFALLLPGADAEQAENARLRLLTAIESTVRVEGIDVDVSMSIGAATLLPTLDLAHADTGESPFGRSSELSVDRLVDELLDRADMAMYEWKTSTRPHAAPATRVS